MASDAGKEVGKCAAILATVEVGLGSFFHAFHVPTSGHWLSLNQAFWLSRLSFRTPGAKTSPMTASNVTACLKSLSPAGKRLSPMLAISAQGGLFNAGTFLLGENVFGASLGAVLLSFWAFVHPVLIYYLIFGQTLIAAYAKLYQKCQAIFHFSNAQAFHAIALIVSVKAILAVGVVLLARVLPQAQVDRFQLSMTSWARRSARPVPAADSGTDLSLAARGAIRDLLRPLFLVSLALTAVFFIWSESSHVALIWGLLRPLAVGFILFFGVRILPLEAVIALLERRGFAKFAGALRFARAELANDRN